MFSSIFGLSTDQRQDSVKQYEEEGANDEQNLERLNSLDNNEEAEDVPNKFSLPEFVNDFNDYEEQNQSSSESSKSKNTVDGDKLSLKVDEESKYLAIADNYRKNITKQEWNDKPKACIPPVFRKLYSDSNNNPDQDSGALETDHLTRQRANALIESLFLGYTAANVFSNVFLLDDQQVKRVALLGNLVGIKIYNANSDLYGIHDNTNIHAKSPHFRFCMEYGVGDDRVKWSLVKSYKDLTSFANKINFSFANISKSLPLKRSDFNIPKFPKLKTELKQDGDFYKQQDGNLDKQQNGNCKNQQDGNFDKQQNGNCKNQQYGNSGNLHNMLILKSLPSFKSNNRRKLDEKYTEKLERYFRNLFLELSLKPQANKLFQFFEMSPVGVLLADKNGYSGKQGYLLVAGTAKSQGWRVGHLKAKDWGPMIKRHTLKWVCIRDSYIVYVSNIQATTLLDVFLVDECFRLKCHQERTSKKLEFKITLKNNERSLKLITRSAFQHNSWLRAVEEMRINTEWATTKRFGSFAPIRHNCYAQWFVDARDYWWAASSAIEMAKDVIFVHDWWLSPELYLRRPARGNQEWRIDRLLKRKAEQGVKIFIIVYRNIGEFLVIDSSWTKHSMMDLHENIRVLRSPNQFLQNTFFWAHHEKLLIIDHTIAFLGGVDLCYGRYDTPEHVLVENETKESHIFPGKDYSNPRVSDFFQLESPYESMYDRENVPRMPWHDVHMVNVGQVARDLSRHFVQRWNYLIRQKRPSRPTPLLVPPAQLSMEEVKEMGFEGTCEVQLLRSSGSWSLGLKETEHSIQNAYLKLIETSEHFVYIENQFFVTTCAWDTVVIKNKIGDALVDRIYRAHREKTPWRAVIVIPLTPGFPAQIDEHEGSSVRVIMKCQYMSISRGTTSIFAKLREGGIDPHKYIQFFSLRKWGKIGDKDKLVTEQLYIHAKTMVVDDRVAIIGSANINERSMRGNRDSEICAIVRDTKTCRSTMGGKPFIAAHFAHSLRMRLMREHLGVHVDELDLVERQFDSIKTHVLNSNSTKSEMVNAASKLVLGVPEETTEKNGRRKPKVEAFPLYKSFNHRAWEENIGLRDKKLYSTDPRVRNNENHKDDVAGKGIDNFASKQFVKWKLNVRKSIQKWALECLDTDKLKPGRVPNKAFIDMLLDDEKSPDGLNEKLLKAEEQWESLKRISYIQRVVNKHSKLQNQKSNLNANKSNISLADQNIDPKTCSQESKTPIKSLSDKEIDELFSKHLKVKKATFIDPYGFKDPLDDKFYQDIWLENAYRNTKIYRLVFHCQPDNTVTTWKEYKLADKLTKAFFQLQDREISQEELYQSLGEAGENDDPVQFMLEEKYQEKDMDQTTSGSESSQDALKEKSKTLKEKMAPSNHKHDKHHYQKNMLLDKKTAEKILSQINGHLVMFPVDWLSEELDNNNWFANTDRLPPIEIYN